MTKTEIEIHPAQAEILKILLFRTEAAFSKLNANKMPTDHFSFHLRQLTEKKLLVKTGGGTYQLSPIGKEFANRLDTETVKIERQAKISVGVIGIQTKGRKKQYLIQQRLKQPYYGYHGIVTGKIRWGETILEAAVREFKEETNLTAGKLEFGGIEHKMDYNRDGQLLDDKYFCLIRALNPKGNFTENFEGGRNVWRTEKETRALENLFGDVPAIFYHIKRKPFFFFEEKFTVIGF